MSIFGTSNSKFKSGVTEVELQYSTIRPQWLIPQTIEHRSIMNGKINIIKIANDKARFEVVVNLWKYAVPKTSAQDILTYNHDTVKFMPHEDSGEYITEDGINEADFFISEMRMFYVRNRPPVLQDRLLIVFESLTSIVLPKIVPVFLVDEAGDFLVDEAGEKLLR